MSRSAIIIVAALLTACNSPPRPDLARLYAMQANPDQPPVVVVHGVLGGRLADTQTGREVWPASTWKLLFSDYRELRLDIDPETLRPRTDSLHVTGITDQAAGRDFYGRILEVLRDAGGYESATPGRAVTAGRKYYYVFSYDWRQDNVETVRRLDAFIEQIRRDHDDPTLQVDIIAHSMGGLVTRYYTRYGTQDVLDDDDFPVNNHGAGRVRRAILLGTPNLGSAKAIRTLLEGFDLGFKGIPVEVVATFPSTYQLLPHPLNQWLIKSDGQPLQRDLFSDELWRRFEFAIYDPRVRARILARYDDEDAGRAYLEVLERFFARQLYRARRFVWSLTVPVPDPDVRYVVFGGDCDLTPARILVEEVDGESVVRLWPDEITNPQADVDYDMLMLEPGDGVVTKASLLARQSLDPTVARHRYSFFPLRYSFFLCESHDRLTGNITFQDNLLNALLSADED